MPTTTSRFAQRSRPGRAAAAGAFGLRRRKRPLRAGTLNEAGASLLEFAFTVPILIALVAGAWDFGSAFALKDKMTNAAREAARVAVSNSVLPPVGSSATCSSATATPCNIVAAISALQYYMENAGATSVSCIQPDSPTNSSGETYTYTCSSVPGLQIVIDHDAAVTVDGAEALKATTVSFQYPVKWWFSILGGSGPTANVTTLQTSVTMANLVF